MSDVQPDAALISQAVVTWITGSERPYPSVDDAQVVARYGPETAARLFPALRQLESDCFASDAAHRGADIAEVAALARADLRLAHPELSDEAVRALTNLYAFRWK